MVTPGGSVPRAFVPKRSLKSNIGASDTPRIQAPTCWANNPVPRQVAHEGWSPQGVRYPGLLFPNGASKAILALRTRRGFKPLLAGRTTPCLGRSLTKDGHPRGFGTQGFCSQTEPQKQYWRFGHAEDSSPYLLGEQPRA